MRPIKIIPTFATNYKPKGNDMRKFFTTIFCLLVAAGTWASENGLALTSNAVYIEESYYTKVEEGVFELNLETADRLALGCELKNWNEGNNWDYGWAFFSLAGDITKLEIGAENEYIEYGWGWDNNMSEKYWSFDDLPEGTYQLRPVSRVSGTTDWQINHGADKHYLNVTRTGNKLTFTFPEQPTFNLSIAPTVNNLKEDNGYVMDTYADITLHVTNNGDATYNDRIIVRWYHVIDENLNGEFFGNIEQSITVQPGQTVDIDASASGFQDGEMYFCWIYYISADEETTGCPWPPLFTFYDTNVANLSLQPSVKNATDGVVAESAAVFNINVTNNRLNTYNNKIIARVYKITSGKQGNYVGEVSKLVSIESGKTADVELTFNDIEDGASYFYYAYYISQDAEVEYSDYSPFFAVDFSLTGLNAAAKASGTVCVYDLSGKLLAETSSDQLKQVLTTLPKGIYVVKTADSQSSGIKIRN